MSTYMSSLGGVSGLASGVNWRDIIDGLLAVERRPILSLQNREAGVNARLTALREINSLVLALKDKAFKVSLRSSVLARSATVDGNAVTATATADAVAGVHKVTVYQLATPTRAVSTAFLGREVAVDVPIGEAGMSVTPTAGFFTINGIRITIGSSTTLDAGSDSVTALINSSGSGVVASMERDIQGRLNLFKLYQAEGSINLGSGADTSNFLSAARLYGTDPRSTWTSAVAEGSVEGKVAGDVSSDATISFQYGGEGYVTMAGALTATAEATTLAEFASQIQEAMNEALGNAGSVTVSVLDVSGTGNGKLVITDDRTGGNISVVSLSGTSVEGLEPLLASSGATQGETIISSSGLGKAVAGNYLYTARLATALKDSRLSGVLESSENEGVAGFDLAGTETVSFTYHGFAYETDALEAVTAGLTDLADVAADLESKMNAALGEAGSVKVSIYDPDGTGNARLVITDESPEGGNEISFSFTSAPTVLRLFAEEGAEAKGLFVVNGTAVTYDKYHDTLNMLLSRINSSVTGVRSVYDSVTDSVTMTATSTGSASIYLEDVGGNILEALHLTGEGAQSLGENARFSIDTVAGGEALTSGSNDVEGLVPGVVFRLRQVSERDEDGNYIPTTVVVDQDVDTALKAVREFVEAYNALVDKLYEYTKYDSKTKQAGVLNGVSQARDLLRRLKDYVGYQAQGLEGYPRTLREIGLTWGGSDINAAALTTGKLSLDENKLSAALRENESRVFNILAAYAGNVSLRSGGTGSVVSVSGRPRDVTEAGTYRIVSDASGNLTAYFTPSGGSETLVGTGTITAGGRNDKLIPGVVIYAAQTLREGTDYLDKETSATGVVKNLEDYLAEIGRSGGMIANVEDRLEKEVEDLEERISMMEERLKDYEARLVSQFTAMEALLSQMQTQSQWLSNQVNLLNRNWASGR